MAWWSSHAAVCRRLKGCSNVSRWQCSNVSKGSHLLVKWQASVGDCSLVFPPAALVFFVCSTASQKSGCGSSNAQCHFYISRFSSSNPPLQYIVVFLICILLLKYWKFITLHRSNILYSTPWKMKPSLSSHWYSSPLMSGSLGNFLASPKRQQRASNGWSWFVMMIIMIKLMMMIFINIIIITTLRMERIMMIINSLCRITYILYFVQYIPVRRLMSNENMFGHQLLFIWMTLYINGRCSVILMASHQNLHEYLVLILWSPAWTFS